MPPTCSSYRLKAGRLAAATLAAALTALLVAWVAPGSDRDAATARRAAATGQAVSAKRSPAEYYESTVARGAPVAVLGRRTALFSAPRWSSRRQARLRRRTEWGSPRVLAVVGRSGRWLRVIATQLRNGRRAWVPMNATSLVANPWRIEADLSSRRVTVFRRGSVMRRFSVAVGSPRTPTPTGSFAVTDKLELIGGSASYGCCALALSGHQPNVAQGWSGGDRLAIHGTHELGSIGRASSLGCLRAREADVRWIVGHVYLGTLVRIRR